MVLLGKPGMTSPSTSTHIWVDPRDEGSEDMGYCDQLGWLINKRGKVCLRAIHLSGEGFKEAIKACAGLISCQNNHVLVYRNIQNIFLLHLHSEIRS